MWLLRLILIVLGVAFIAGVYWYTRRHPPRAEADEGRIEPSFAPERVPPTMNAEAAEAAAPGAGADAAAPESGPAGPAPPASADPGTDIFTLTLRLPGEGAPAAQVLETLARLDFAPGEQQIYHRTGPDGAPLCSAADLFEPGILHPLPEDARLRGLVFFFRASPGPEASGRLDRMLGAARECARRLQGRVEDGSHRPLTAARELELKLAAAGARSAH